MKKDFEIDDWRRFFPYDSVRPQQEEAINFALDAFVNKDKKFVVLELPTGIGKSATGLTIAKYLNSSLSIKDDEGMPTSGAYVLTPQKILQDQYDRDFGQQSKKNLLCSLKSSTNYKCNFYDDFSCAESKRLLSQLGEQARGTEFQKTCKNNCNYTKAKSDFTSSDVSVTNFSYFLSEVNYVGKFDKRTCLVIDEAHVIENELTKFTEVSFSEKFAKELLKCKIPKLDSPDAVIEWVKNPYRKALMKFLRELSKKIDSDTEKEVANIKQYEMLDKHLSKLDKFVELYDEKNWVMNVTRPVDQRRSARRFEFKPIDVSCFSDPLFQMGHKVLLMSATIVNFESYCKSIGIPVADAAYLRLKSPFDANNHPIHYLPVGNMSKDKIEQSLPSIVEVVSMLLQTHRDVKGLIHCVNFKIANYLKDHLNDPRVLTHESSNRDAVLKTHVESPSPTVLLSPSMMEGVDLRDDLSRFQIICKMPFPYLGDPVVKKKMHKDKNWYSYSTAKMLIQSVGRSVRSIDDHAVTYILDSDWGVFFSRNRHLFPKHFLDSYRV